MSTEKSSAAEKILEAMEKVAVPKLPKFTEFETKYRTDLSVLGVFKRIVRALPGPVDFLYAEGPDVYYSNSEGTPGRYRVTEYPKEEQQFAQWTIKIKPEGAKNNIIRGEPNWKVRGTPFDEIDRGAQSMGFKFNFKIWKMCHIYKFKDVTLVFYTVIKDGSTKEDHFIEIEVDEDTIDQLTEDEAWATISKYEKILEETGINAQKRMKRSLYEMYREEVK